MTEELSNVIYVVIFYFTQAVYLFVLKFDSKYKNIKYPVINDSLLILFKCL